MITQLQPVSVVFNLPQQALTQVAAAHDGGLEPSGPEVLAYTQGSESGRSKPLDQGTLTVLDNQIDPTTGTIKLKATISGNKAGTHCAGRYCRHGRKAAGRHRARRDSGAAGAPCKRGPRWQVSVYVVDLDSTAHRRNVTIGYEDDHRVGGEQRHRSLGRARRGRWCIATDRWRKGLGRRSGAGGADRHPPSRRAGHASARLGAEWLSGGRRETASALETQPGDAVPWTPVKGRGPLKSIHWVGVRGGPTRSLRGHGRPSSHINPNSMVPRAAALGGGPGGRASSWGSGAERPDPCPDEHFRPVHRAADCYVAVGVGHFAVRRPWLSLVAGIGVAGGGFSDHPGGDPVARRRSGDWSRR